MSIGNSVINQNGITDYMLMLNANVNYRFPAANLEQVYTDSNTSILVERAGTAFKTTLNNFFSGLGTNLDNVLVERYNTISNVATLYKARNLLSYVLGDYELTANPAVTDENAVVVFDFLADTEGTYLWYVDHITTDDDDFLTAPPSAGSPQAFATANFQAQFSLITSGDGKVEGAELFDVKVVRTVGGRVLANTSVTILDTSRPQVILDAGPNQGILNQPTITLLGSVLNAEPGFTVEWQQIEGPNVTLSNVNILTPSFAPVPSNLNDDYVFRLIYNPGANSELSDITTVTPRIVSYSFSETWQGTGIELNNEYRVFAHQAPSLYEDNHSIYWSTPTASDRYKGINIQKLDTLTNTWTTVQQYSSDADPHYFVLSEVGVYRVASVWFSNRLFNASNPRGVYVGEFVKIEPGVFKVDVAGGYPVEGESLYSVGHGDSIGTQVVSINNTTTKLSARRLPTVATNRTIDIVGSQVAEVSGLATTKYAGKLFTGSNTAINTNGVGSRVASVSDLLVTRFSGISIGGV